MLAYNVTDKFESIFFSVSEPDASVDSTAVVASLAQQLDTYPDNKDFSWDDFLSNPYHM